MRYLASEKLEIIRVVEQSHPLARLTLDKLGIPRATFHRLEPHSRRGAGADRRIRPRQAGAVATRTGGNVHRHRKLFCLGGFGKAHDLITSPAFTSSRLPTSSMTRQLRRTAVADRLHLSEGHRLGLVLSLHHSGRLLPLYHRLEAMHDHEGGGHRHADLALTASGCDRATVCQRPRLVSDNGPCYMAAAWPIGSRIKTSSAPAARPAIRRPRARSSDGTRR